MDSLLSIVQMPAGIPVGTLAIGRPGAVNAALLAAAILALADPALADRLDAYRAAQTAAVADQPVRPRAVTALPPNATIGIVGGGQLGRMSAMAAARLGYRCHILTPEPDSPAARSPPRTLGDYEDPARCAPSPRRGRHHLRVRERQRRGARPAGLDPPGPPVARRPAHQPGPRGGEDLPERRRRRHRRLARRPHRAELHAAVAALGLPAVLKTTRGGYDGKGQAVLRDPADLDAAWDDLDPKPLILEGFVDFALRDQRRRRARRGRRRSAFDPVENRHRDGILDLTLAPARIAPAPRPRPRASPGGGGGAGPGRPARRRDVRRPHGRVLVNEIAPRPHNSGHWTIDACPASQFELHIRAVAGLPLPPGLRHSDAVMKNLVGPEELALWPAILATPGLIPHLYGKAEARPGRKMGHVTRLFPRGTLPDDAAIAQALGPAAPIP